MSTKETERPESTTQQRYAPPQAVAGLAIYPKPVSFIGFVLYLAFAVAFVAAAFEIFPSVAPLHRARSCLAESLVHTHVAATDVAAGLGPALGC